MELSFNKEQVDKLLTYATIGFHVIASNKETREESIDAEREFLNVLFKQSHEAGHDFIEQNEELGYVPTQVFDEMILDEMSEFENENAFEILSDMLALRDIEEEYPSEELSKIEDEQFENLMDEYVEAYDEEFLKNGVQNLYLVEGEGEDENEG